MVSLLTSYSFFRAIFPLGWSSKMPISQRFLILTVLGLLGVLCCDVSGVGAELGTLFAGPIVYCLAQQVFGYAVKERLNMNHYIVRHTLGL
jgi:hypothetical protein